MSDEHDNKTEFDLAVTGMAGRFPGAQNVDEYWRNVRDGVESIVDLTDEALRAAGVTDAQLADPDYVRRGAPLAEMEGFDAEFFGFNSNEAAVLDPQHRHFLECSWEALEHAGYTPTGLKGSVGVYAGSGMHAYMAFNLLRNPSLMESMGFFLVRHTGNDKDFLATRVSYELNLKGPSINVQTACSTSLVALHLAYQALLNGEIDMALAGGATIEVPHRQGYVYKEGEILSPDGRCRAFDASSQGTVFGSGVGVVVLRRLSDAVADGDCIHAVIKGSAINNDGSMKIGYLAPSVDGQAQAITEALSVADVDAQSIGYVETHGTGTPVGDPIEVAALTQAFRTQTDKTGFCAIGSVKSNIGHCDTAAGVASLIKAVQALRHKQIPPSLHFESPNPACDFENTPFYVNSKLVPWEAKDGPRRAGVSSLGVGGTNAHIILEEAPNREPSSDSREWQLLLLSAKTDSALDDATVNLAEHLRENPALNLADVAYTQMVGRLGMAQRRFLICRDAADATGALEPIDPLRVVTRTVREQDQSVAFMFAGLGAQYPMMANDLCRTEPVFRAVIDECLQALETEIDYDLKRLMFPPEAEIAASAEELKRPTRASPATFMIQYAQAKLWMSWGIQPTAMIGHSFGEYTAACLAGVLSVKDVLAMSVFRGKLMESAPAGAMLSVFLTEDELLPLLGSELSLAAINAPGLCAASGPTDAIEALQATLTERSIDNKRIRVDVAGHSMMLDPLLDGFAEFVGKLTLNEPTIPYISSNAGTWITPVQATDPSYWARQMRQTVRFTDGIGELLSDPNRALVEAGPGKTLATLAKMHDSATEEHTILSSTRPPDLEISDVNFMLDALGRLWAAGVTLDGTKLYEAERRHRVPLPTYPFEHRRYWIAAEVQAEAAESSEGMTKKADLADWFYLPAWKRTFPPRPQPGADSRKRVLVFSTGSEFDREFIARAQADGADVVTVLAGPDAGSQKDDVFRIDPSRAADYERLLTDLQQRDSLPQAVYHMWNANRPAGSEPDAADVEKTLQLSFFSLLYFAQAVGELGIDESMRVVVVTSGTQQVAGEALPSPIESTLLGPCLVIPREFSNLQCQSIDVGTPAKGPRARARLIERLLAEVDVPGIDQVIAYRSYDRLVRVFEPDRLEDGEADTRVREGGTYLITGGLGGIGMAVAKELANVRGVKLALMSRSKQPERDEWDKWLSTQPEHRTSRKLAAVRELEELGAEIALVSGDVTDEAQVTQVLADVQRTLGPIRGVFHCAGVLDDSPIQLKTTESAMSVLAPKVLGTLVLDRALQDTELDFVALFSSVSSFVGMVGQVDYAAANAFLDAYAHHRTVRDGTPVVALNWTAWQEVGMAAELAATLSGEDLGTVREVAHPMLDRCVVDSGHEVTYATVFSPTTHWVLGEHRLRGGNCLIPGAGYVELVRAAFCEANEAPRVELSNVFFLAPFMVPDGETRELRVQISRTGASADFLVYSQQGSNGTREEHVSGTVAAAKNEAPSGNLQRLKESCAQRAEVTDSLQLDFGPRWKNVMELQLGDNEALLRLELPSTFVDDLEQFKIHPALLDMATAGAQTLIDGYDPRSDLFVPMGCEVLRYFGGFQPTLYSHIRYRPAESGHEVAAFDVTIMDERGQVLVIVDQFMMRRVENPTLIAEQTVQPTAPQAETSGSSAVSQFLEQSLRLGVSPQEGVSALQRVVGALSSPQVVISPCDLDALTRHLHSLHGTNAHETASGHLEDDPGGREVEQALEEHVDVKQAAVLVWVEPEGERQCVAYLVPESDQLPADSEFRRHLRKRVSFEFVPQHFVKVEMLEQDDDGRLDLEALPDPFGGGEDYVGPSTETEGVVTEVWKQALGAKRIGMLDNFFEMGGHSLLATRIATALSRQLGVKLPLQLVLQLPTISEQAKYVDTVRWASEGTGDAAEDSGLREEAEI